MRTRKNCRRRNYIVHRCLKTLPSSGLPSNETYVLSSPVSLSFKGRLSLSRHNSYVNCILKKQILILRVVFGKASELPKNFRFLSSNQKEQSSSKVVTSVCCHDDISCHVALPEPWSSDNIRRQDALCIQKPFCLEELTCGRMDKTFKK